MGVKLNSDACVNQAAASTGLDDFGGQTFKTGLDALVDSLNTDADLNEAAAGYFQGQIYQLLVNRLEVTRLLKEAPEIPDEQIRQPVFIVGLPRSGTTILQTLLALDPTSRYLRNYEASGPICPPPELIPETIDPRIQTYHDAMAGIFNMAPELKGINGINFISEGTAECQNLMAHEFVHMGWSCGSSLFSHGSWVADCDMETAYQWHKRLLQILQWKLPNDRWILKAPMHLFRLDQLLEAYPDARIIFTHRNPSDAIVSGVSMVHHWTQFTTGRADLPAIVDWYTGLWAKGLYQALEVKPSLPAEQCMDIYFKDISTDPVGVIKHIYTHFDIPLSDGAVRRMQIWLNDHPRSHFGSHTCTPEAYGLKKASIDEQFAFYTDALDSGH